jgi:hypothetical protein
MYPFQLDRITRPKLTLHRWRRGPVGTWATASEILGKPRNSTKKILSRSPRAARASLSDLHTQGEARAIAKSLRNETVRAFLLKEFERFSFGYRAHGTAPIQNRVVAFLADPLLNRILSAPENDLHIRRLMDDGKVLLVSRPRRGPRRRRHARRP